MAQKPGTNRKSTTRGQAITINGGGRRLTLLAAFVSFLCNGEAAGLSGALADVYGLDTLLV
ncbi:hypothetical protein D0Y50_04985 [Salinimonas sediminis]|uniref:Uncharacterized protein n=1 Tax=Salinimonas sediminis TaxID=2303538 RepID=A0A346NJT3_9ALTE|nr:hypothetical protein D0Y50_04985 [Salinimonas sediminis]